MIDSPSEDVPAVTRDPDGRVRYDYADGTVIQVNPTLDLASRLLGPDAAHDVSPSGVMRAVSPPEDRSVTCAVCKQPGVVEELDPVKGFLISHGDRLACRAPVVPPEAPDGELTVPVEINLN